MSLDGFECLAGEPSQPSGSMPTAGPEVSGDPVPAAADSPLDPVGQALRKLHNNRSSFNGSFLRVVRNSGAPV